jgi:hypothetical protein
VPLAKEFWYAFEKIDEVCQVDRRDVWNFIVSLQQNPLA